MAMLIKRKYLKVGIFDFYNRGCKNLQPRLLYSHQLLLISLVFSKNTLTFAPLKASA